MCILYDSTTFTNEETQEGKKSQQRERERERDPTQIRPQEEKKTECSNEIMGEGE